MQLEPEQQKIVQQILDEEIPGSHVRIFGSRAQGTKKRFADLDLLIQATRPLSIRTVRRLRDRFSDSSLPFRVDIVDAKTVSPDFLKRIESEAIEIPKSI